MKKGMRIILPIILVIVILACSIWYLFIYDRPFARDMLLSFARISEESGSLELSEWFYNQAYNLADQDDAASRDQVAIELSEQYKRTKNYTKAEYTLSNAIANGGGIDLYIALCQTFVEQDKLYDAVNMLDNVKDPEIKAQLDALRPAAPELSPDPSRPYNQYISVSATAESGTLFVASNGRFPSKYDAPYSEPLRLTDGENVINALVLSDDNLVSALTSETYTVGGVVKEITFVDPAVEAEVRKLLNVSDDKQLLNSDLWKITEFTVPEGTANYADLVHMTFLTKLTLENGVSGDLSCIGAMTNLTDLTIKNTVVTREAVEAIGTLIYLENLTLENCNLSNISAFKGATAIVTLNLSHNAISDINALSSMKDLKELNLEHNVITAISPLSALASLTKLDISNNVISSLAPISGISALTWLDAGTNAITELGDMSSLTALTYLCLNTNKLVNVSTLANCTALTELDIAKNSVTDISKLAALTNMITFDFSNNQVTALPEFTTTCALATIKGAYNNISTLQPLSGLDNLNNVFMDYNSEISSVKCLANCYKLIEVNVYGTKVSDVSALTGMDVIVNYNPT